MPPPVPEQLSKTIETLYRSESGRVLATLVRLLGDLDLAEEAMHEAFAAALEFWSQTGIPDKPRPWLISTARFKAIDVIRRRARFDGAQRDLVAHMESRVNDAPGGNEETGDQEIEDDCLSTGKPCFRGPDCFGRKNMLSAWVLLSKRAHSSQRLPTSTM